MNIRVSIKHWGKQLPHLSQVYVLFPQRKDSLCVSTLITTDPNKNPTHLSQATTSGYVLWYVQIIYTICDCISCHVQLRYQKLI